MELWFPGNSLEEKHKNQEHVNTAECTPENRKQKRRKATVKIERRKEATVNTQAVANIESEIGAPSLSDSSVSKGYSTIESTSSNGLDKYANWEDSQQEESTVCGWKNCENIGKLAMMNRPLNSSFYCNSKNNIQAKVASNRLYSSRLNTQMSKKREKYQFTHAETPEEHMQVYREHCSYSYLILYNRNRRPNTVAAPTTTGIGLEGESNLTNKDDRHMHNNELTNNKNYTARNTYRPKPVTAMGTSRKVAQSMSPDTKVPSIPLITKGTRTERDRVLHSLANRLGVNESIDEPKLLSPVVRRTPPSITKKKTALKEDLVLQPCSEKNEASSSNSESRPITKQSKQRHTSQLLPNLQNEKKKSTSSISLSKYFHVNMTTQPNEKHHEIDPTLVQDEDEDTVLPDHCTDTSPLLSPPDEDNATQGSTLRHSDKWPLFIPSADPLGSFVQKEEAIKRKADSLGLMSHKWAKNFIERGFVDGHLSRKIYYEYSRQPTQGTSDGATTNSSQVQSNVRNVGKLSAKQNEKLRELKELYAVSSNRSGTQSRRDKREKNNSNGIHKQQSRQIKSNRNKTRLAQAPAKRHNVLNKEELESAFKKLNEFKLHTQALLKD